MKNITDIYHIIDEDFMSGFSNNHLSYMKEYYYNFYKLYCTQNNKTYLPKDNFYTNMRRHKIKLVQICCPYCGNMNILVAIGSLASIKSLKYCTSCGKRSATENAYIHVSRIIRIQQFHEAGLQMLTKQNSTEDLTLMSLDIYQLELIELTSIIEACLRDFFISFVYLKYKDTRTKYINNIIEKNIANDFMNIEKANNHFKKALKINLRALLSQESWNRLIDIVQIRNTLIHNNGLIDNKFRNSNTYIRISKLIHGNLIFLDKESIKKYLETVTELLSEITRIFNEQYPLQIHSLIANYYFNHLDANINNTWISLHEAVQQAKINKSN